MHEALKVYLKDTFVGWLSHEMVGDEYSFEYDDAYLASPVEGALSFALPLTGEKFDSPHTFNFFANLLPPRVVRQRLGSSLHLSQHNVFGFLKAIGGECAGRLAEESAVSWPSGVYGKVLETVRTHVAQVSS